MASMSITSPYQWKRTLIPLAWFSVRAEVPTSATSSRDRVLLSLAVLSQLRGVALDPRDSSLLAKFPEGVVGWRARKHVDWARNGGLG